MPKAWMVRAGEGGDVIEDFIEKNVVAIGWAELPDLSGVHSRDELKKLIEQNYREDRPGQRRSWFAQVGTFRFDIKKGDAVVTYNPDTREYHLGNVTGDYQYRSGVVQDYPHTHQVAWFAKVSRDDLSVQSKNTLGAIQAVFSLEDVIDELNSFAKGEKQSKAAAEGLQMDQLRQNVISQSHEFIKDRLQALSWEDMQDLVAGLLRAMGYQTRVSPPGADRGKDIIASPDGLGLGQPRIRVEVKHRPKEVISSATLRSFLGAFRQGDHGIYVATGTYSKEARYEAERAQHPITLLDLGDLVALLTQHYEKLDSETRAMVPLIRVYWPAT
jgi:restriction system protein